MSRFASDLISTEERKAFRFQDGLSPFLKDKLSLHNLETYSEVVESALLAERSAKKVQKYREQPKRGRPDYPQGVQTQKRQSTSRDKGVRPIQEIGKDNVTPCGKCGKQHGGIVCYKEVGACFNCGVILFVIVHKQRILKNRNQMEESLSQGPKEECFP